MIRSLRILLWRIRNYISSNKKLHPDVVEFWKPKVISSYRFYDKSYKFWYYFSNPKDYFDFWPGFEDLICEHHRNKEMVYFYDGKSYSEKDMLRMIKLKSFL